MTDPNELREIERERLRALVRGDVAGAGEVHADNFQLINPAGEALFKEEYFGLISSGQFNYRLWEPESISVRLYGDRRSDPIPRHNRSDLRRAKSSGEDATGI